MKKILKLKQDFWDVNEKGNILILGIIVMNIIILLASNINILLQQKLILNNYDSDMEVIKIKVIQKIENECTKDTPEDFTFEEGNIYVSATYVGLDYFVNVEGKKKYEMLVEYDPVYECILNVEYNFED